MGRLQPWHTQGNPVTYLNNRAAVHHHMLTQMGVHLSENARLAEMANDRVYTACTMILPLREKGAAGSPVRPVAIGA